MIYLVLCLTKSVRWVWRPTPSEFPHLGRNVSRLQEPGQKQKKAIDKKLSANCRNATQTSTSMLSKSVCLRGKSSAGRGWPPRLGDWGLAVTIARALSLKAPKGPPAKLCKGS